MTRTVRCCCGDLCMTVSGEPALSGICHCGDCRRRSGSAFGWSAYFPDASIVATSGSPSLYEVKGEMPQRRSFCRHCGSTLWWTNDLLPGMIGIAGGAFVENPLPPPGGSYHDSKKCGWVVLPEDWARQG